MSSDSLLTDRAVPGAAVDRAIGDPVVADHSSGDGARSDPTVSRRNHTGSAKARRGTEVRVNARFDGLRLRRLAGHIGAEVLDVKLGADLSDDDFEQIRAALLAHKVLFFRDQGHLDDDAQQTFGARFGRVIAHPTVPPLTGTQLLELDASQGGGRADSWHTDITFLEAFPKYSILRGVVIPAWGGDTVWANTAHAYERLPDVLKLVWALSFSLAATKKIDFSFSSSRYLDVSVP